MGKKINFKNPQSYNEKLNWLKLYDRKPEYLKMVDKFDVKEYVSAIIGEKYVIPALGVWDKFEEINFDELPNQFVLKCTHDSGSVIFCRDKANFDFIAAKKKLKIALKKNPYLPSREWVYSNIKPRIIAEKFIEDKINISLIDYKFFCFNGEPKCLFVGTDRHLGDEHVKFDFFDSEFNHLDIIQLHEQSDKKISRPISFDDMLRLSKVLSAGIPHVRVDFYEIDNKPYFGEFTFYHHGGIIPFKTEKWDEMLGSWIKLPDKN
jgi:hypothetical protein